MDKSIEIGTEALGEDRWAIVARVEGRGDFRRARRYQTEDAADKVRDRLREAAATIADEAQVDAFLKDGEFRLIPSDGSDRLTA